MVGQESPKANTMIFVSGIKIYFLNKVITVRGNIIWYKVSDIQTGLFKSNLPPGN